ncbi:MAG: SpoVR family protein [Bdellovibrionales bacterium]|nr:SpoVR family protein [Bdellovibrionales bacterium]
MGHLPYHLEEERKRIWELACAVGLDCYETIFEMVTYDQMNQFAAYGGFPVRYPHWRFGMEYDKLSKSYEYGLSKIYEMVINNDPCYAYLMEGNRTVDQKLVMAHVYGHCDFFKNNKWFEPTDRKMMNTMANHATRIRRYMDRYGVDAVEDFIDKCLSIENLIDRYAPYSPSKVDKRQEKQDQTRKALLKFDREYMDEYVNPDHRHEFEPKEEDDRMAKVPERPERDVLLFLMHHAPLKHWQQDVLSIIRNEAYYFAPQGMTKIMNEGWASYWHSKLMTESIMTDSEVIDYADACAGTLAMSPMGFNPYKIGIELFRNIEERWNKGQFGLEWSQCDDIAEKKAWNTDAGLGREKIFQVRRDYNDVTFIDEFLTEEFCVENKMFVYKFNQRSGRYEVDTRQFPLVKQQLLFQLTNFGQPIIHVENANFNNRGELLLNHLFEGVEIQYNYAQETLKNLFAIWKRPVNLLTVIDEKQKILRHDGTELKTIDVLAESQVKSAEESTGS